MVEHLEHLDLDVAILGGGLCGALAAGKCARYGKKVGLLRLTDETRPVADTLRSTARLLSGLRFVKYEPEFAKRLGPAGKKMLWDNGFGIPTGGIYQTTSSTKVEEIQAQAAMLGLAELPVLRERVAARSLGPFYRVGAHCLLVPDGPFDIAQLLTVVRAELDRLNVPTFDLADKSHIDIGYRGGNYLINFPTGSFRARTLFLCAGSGNISLAQKLGILPADLEERVSIYKCGVLRIESKKILRVPLFDDLDEKRLAITSFLGKSQEGKLRRMYQVGPQRFEALKEDPLDPTSRIVDSEKEGQPVLEYLSAFFDQEDLIESKWTGGHLVRIGERIIGTPRVFDLEKQGFRSAFMVFPGRLTFTDAITDDALMQAGIQAPRETVESATVAQTDRSQRWTKDIRAHADYPDLDDSRKATVPNPAKVGESLL